MTIKVNVICPRSLRFNILKLLFLRNATPIEAKFHIEPPWDGERGGRPGGNGRLDESEYKWFMSHAQDGRHAHVW